MTAIPIHSGRSAVPADSHGSPAVPADSPSPASGDRAIWVPIDEAAVLLGVTEGNLRRRCQALADQGMATKRLSGGVHKWFIAAAYSARLRRRSIEAPNRSDGDDGGSDLQQLLKSTTAAKRDRAMTDMQILIAFRAFKSGGGSTAEIKDFIKSMKDKHGRCPGQSRLYEMDKDCPASDDRDGILYKLIDRRGRPKGDLQSCSDQAWDAFGDLYLHPNQPSMRKCWRAVRGLAAEHGWAWPSYSRVRQLAEQRYTHSMIALKREGTDAWNRKFLAPMEQDPNAWEPGQLWESDHCVMDMHIRVIRGDRWVRTRPQLTAWLDRRTRLLTGWHISEQGNQYTIRTALMHALKTNGISPPEIVWLDNGKDFMARSITGMTKADRRKATRDEQEQAESASTGLLNMLGIEPHFANAYNHNGKARIERFFGTCHGEFDKDFPGYSGNRPGMLDKLEHQGTQKEIMALPTLGEVREKWEEYAAWYNCRSEHYIDDLRDPETMERLAPIEFYHRYPPATRAIKRASLKLLEPVWSTPLKVHKTGISLRIGGGTVRYGDLAPELEDLKGSDKRVYVSYDPEDMGSVTVWSEEFKYICEAMQNHRYGGLANDKIKKADLTAGFAARRKQKAEVRRKLDFVTGSLNEAELASKMAREREIGETKARLAEFDRTRDPNDMPSIRLVRTPIDDAPEDIEQQKYRKAVGAEQFMGPDDGEYTSVIEAARDLHFADEDDFMDTDGGFAVRDDDPDFDEPEFADPLDPSCIELDDEDDYEPGMSIMDHLA